MHTDSGGDIVAIGGNNVTYAYLQQLPSDVTGLGTLLDQLYTQENGTGPWARRSAAASGSMSTTAAQPRAASASPGRT
jgi:hypothetical protein